MRPLALVAAGLLVVGIDIRTEHLDLLADPIGWLLVAEGARRRLLTVPAGLAVAAAALSLADLHLPYRRVRVDPETGEVVDGSLLSNAAPHLRFDEVTGLRLALLVLAMVVAGLALWTLLGALADRAAVADPRAARQLRLLRWLVPAGWSLPYVVVAAGSTDGFDPIWNDEREVLALLGLGLLGWVVVLLAHRSGEGWAVAPTPPPRDLGTRGLSS